MTDQKLSCYEDNAYDEHAAFSIWCNCSTVASFHKHTKRRGKKGERDEILLKCGEGMEE